VETLYRKTTGGDRPHFGPRLKTQLGIPSGTGKPIPKAAAMRIAFRPGKFMNIIAMRQINVKKYAKSAAINAKDP